MKGRRPDYTVSTVVQGEHGDRWREIGVAFASEKGTVTVLLDALPVGAKLILTTPRERDRDRDRDARDRDRERDHERAPADADGRRR